MRSPTPLLLIAPLALVASFAAACSNDPVEPGTDVAAAGPAGSPGTGTSGTSGGAGQGGSSGVPAATAGSMSMAPSAGAGGGATDSNGGGSGGAGDGAGERDGGIAADAGDAAESEPVDTGTLPPITDPGEPGAFTPKWEEQVGPNGSYTTITPTELGQGGIAHPIVIWGPGAGAYPAIYKTLLDHIASHGFVIVSYNTTPSGPELNMAIDWIVSESMRDGSPYFDKVDTTKIAMGGQSAGSLATFTAGNDDRLTTTLHINGGSFSPTGVLNLIKPALFICGDDPAVSGGDGTWESDLARPNCDRDFMNAEVPVWYGVVIGSSHTTIIDNPASGMPVTSPELKKAYLAANAAWLRWQLAGDQQMKALFVGEDCGFCMQTAAWLVQQKDLD